MNTTAGQQWMSLALSTNLGSMSKRVQCEYFKELTALQKRFCRTNIELMPSVIKGSIMALKECQYQFKWRRWNCSTVRKARKKQISPFGLALKSGTREAAFVHAIFSAGIANAITKQCSTGKISRCSCDANLRGYSRAGFQWSGCSDNVVFGVRFSKAFVDGYERERWTKAWTFDRVLMNLHNNEAGRKAIENNLAMRCSCHGVSGTCSTRTCSRVIPSFQEIGMKLKEKFDCASMVALQRVGARIALLPKDKRLKPLTNQDLAYLKESPSYCDANKREGSLGTTGRYCNEHSKGIDGCALLCCDRGYRSSIEIVKKRCRCKFKWCCQVTCDTCSIAQKVYKCR
uniref:Protein Wnt n=2 Tax=Rhopilema esculentum TaxID=499914 RepID=A0A024B083_9CNID|nr:Wnt4 [Rhopilema esculentum]